jgi:hypothetical protein
MLQQASYSSGAPRGTKHYLLKAKVAQQSPAVSNMGSSIASRVVFRYLKTSRWKKSLHPMHGRQLSSAARRCCFQAELRANCCTATETVRRIAMGLIYKFVVFVGTGMFYFLCG